MENQESASRWPDVIIGAGFHSGGIAPAIYLACCGALVDAVGLNPGAVVGGFLGFSLLGVRFGTFFGLGSGMVLRRGEVSSKDWWISLAIAVLASCAVCLLGVRLLGEMLVFSGG